MAPSSSTSSSEAARPWLWAGCFVVLVEVAVALAVPQVAPIDAGLRFYSAATEPTFSESVIQWQITRMDQITAPADVVVLGDSAALTSAVPRTIAAGLNGLTVQNLGTIAPLTIAGHVDVLERYLGRHAAPRMVVYIFSDASLSQSSAKVAEVGMLAATRAWLGRDSGWTRRWPTHRLRPWARRLLGGDWYVDWPNDVGIREFMVRTDGFWRETYADFDPDSATADVPIHRDALEGLGRLVELTGEHGSRLLFVHGPVPSSTVDDADTRAHAANEALLQKLTQVWPHVRIARPYLRVLDAAHFGTVNHPKLPAALAHSRWLAGRIRHHLEP